MRHPNIKVVPGESKILISAPHAVSMKKHLRHDPDYTKRREAKVDDIVKTLCDKKGVWGIHTIGKGPIHNWSRSVYRIYKNEVGRIIEAEDIQLLVDVHGARESRPFLVDYDFIHPEKHPKDSSIEELILKHFSTHIPAEKISKGFFRTLNGAGKRTLTHHVRRKHDTAAVQIEINKTLRKKGEYYKLISALESFIHEYSKTHHENTTVGF